MNSKQVILILVLCAVMIANLPSSPVPMPHTTSASVAFTVLTPATVPPDMQFEAEAIVKLTAWNFYDPRDHNLPELITPDADGYRLDPSWDVQRINYVYDWLGFGSVHSYHSIEWSNGKFYEDSTPTDAQNVASFLAAVSHLHPTQTLLSGWDHYDDYPSWLVELIGNDGQRILISSDANNSPDGSPWNVFYNGRIYAQYDGLLAEPLVKLFGIGDRELLATFYPEGGRLSSYFTSGWPPQLIQGFSGLAPIARYLRWHTYPDTGIIEGEVSNWIVTENLGQGFGRAVTGLSSVELTRPDGSHISCALKKNSQADTNVDLTYEWWTISCQPGDHRTQQNYQYQVRFEFSTTSGGPLALDGELHGVWDATSRFMLLPPSEEVLAAISTSEFVQEILHRHVLARTYYSAQGDFSDGSQHIVEGEAIFVGQTTIGDNIVRYSIGAPFQLRDRQLADWVLRKEIIEGMLADIGRLALTKEVLAQNQDVVLNMWYAERYEVPVGAGEYFIGFRCGTDAPVKLPQNGQPLRAFNFNRGMSLAEGKPHFVLLPDTVVLVDSDYPFPNESPELPSIELPDKYEDFGVMRCSPVTPLP